MSDPTLAQALGNAALRPILQAWSKRHRLDDQVDFLIDVSGKKPAKYLFETYIAESGPKLINIDESTLRPIRALAGEEGGYAKMGKPLSDSAKKVYQLVNDAFVSNGQSFVDGVDYLKFKVGTHDTGPSRVATALKLKGPKADQFIAFMKVYLKPRGVEDAYRAYQGMQKLANKAKLDSALVHAGKPADAVVNAYQALKLVPAITKAQAEAIKYFTTAIPTVKLKGKGNSPAEVTRMFNSGRLRAEKANTDYVKAVRLDKKFAAQHAALAADKKKIDELWGDYRQLLGK